MGILEHFSWVAILAALGAGVLLRPLSLLLTGLALRVLGVSKTQVSAWALKSAERTWASKGAENTGNTGVSQILSAFQGRVGSGRGDSQIDERSGSP